MIRRQLNTILRQGETLIVADTDAEVIIYEQIMVLGGSHESTTFNINNGDQTLSLTLPGGTIFGMPIKTVEVVAATATSGVLVRGIAQRKTIFDN